MSILFFVMWIKCDLTYVQPIAVQKINGIYYCAIKQKGDN
jgi:hypothetical protein